jgi:superfamily II DNA/RNA helicase
MADLGFLPVVKRLLDQTPRQGQRMLFSATLDNGVDVLVKRYLSSPTTHSVDPAVAPVSSMDHHVFAVTHADKPDVVRQLASGHDRAVLFMRTKHTAKKLAKQLSMSGIPAVELHGNLSQGARERNLSAFMDGSTRVLVATDIAARGIHVDDVALVVHVDPPTEHKAYLHRSGRTARAGAGGIVVTLQLPEQARDVRTLTKQAGIAPTVRSVRPGDTAIVELAGPAAPLVDYVAVVEQEQPTRQRQSRGARASRGLREQAPQRSGAPRQKAPRGHAVSSPEAREATRTAASSGGAAPAKSSKGPRRATSQAPARTRAELAARAGQQSAPRRGR